MNPDATADVTGLARALSHRIAAAARPRQRHAHLVEDAQGAQLLMVDGTRLYHLPPALAGQFRAALGSADPAVLQGLVDDCGLRAEAPIDDTPLPAPPLHALSLAIAQKCNLGCTYCYAQQGEFGAKAKSMAESQATKAVDLLLAQAAPGAKVNLAFMGASRCRTARCCAA
ncbi:hypothetical protein [Pseudoduganella armeniaca]|uniref:hypothetical protein n=1 Tax=Pseudoduganella armeniaca TaxID=2072590 RepID=UPI001E395E87|nr:hypothetical protein [Pseudoduganella armeniaca]